MTFKDTPVIIGNGLNEEDEVLETFSFKVHLSKNYWQRKARKQWRCLMIKVVAEYYQSMMMRKRKRFRKGLIELRVNDGQCSSNLRVKLEESREKLNFKGKSKISLVHRKGKIIIIITLV